MSTKTKTVLIGKKPRISETVVETTCDEDTLIEPDSKIKRMSVVAEEIILGNVPLKSFRSTSLIITFYEENLSHIDIQNFIEMGLQIIRFKMTHELREDKLRLLAMLRKAQEWVCEKYDVRTWPIAVSLDLPNAAIRTGYMSEKVGATSIVIKEDDIIEMTSDVKFWNKCDHERIFIDDPYTMAVIKEGQIVTFCNGGAKLVCTKVIDQKTLTCKVIRGGVVSDNEFVAFCGIKYMRPSLLKYDLSLLQFGKEIECDIITVYLVRYAITIKRLKKYCGNEFQPIILSTIADQEGLDNFDAILEESSGIVLARDLLTYQLVNRDSLATIQMLLCAKCKKAGKPFFISGGIFEKLLNNGYLSHGDINDVSNAVYQGAGLMLRSYSSAHYVVEAMKILDSICKTVESCSTKPDEFSRLTDEFHMPVTAAEACVLGAVVMSRKSNALAIINPTVTGRTAIQLSYLAPAAVIFAISRSPATARKLQVYPGIISIVYEKPAITDWYLEMQTRIRFAVSYGLKKELLVLGSPYVVIRKATPISPFCDSVSMWYVVNKEIGKYEITCEYTDEDFGIVRKETEGNTSAAPDEIVDEENIEDENEEKTEE